MREGREALRRAREAAGMPINYTIDDAVVKEQVVSQSTQPAETPAVTQPADSAAQTPATEVVEVTEVRDPRLVEGEVALQKARIRRENAAMMQACAMALFAGLSSVAVAVGLYQGNKKTPAAATPPAVK